MLNVYPVMDSSISMGNSPLNGNSNLLHNGYMGMGTATRQQNAVGIQQMTSFMAPVPLTEFATHIDKLKMNNSQLLIQVRNLVYFKIFFLFRNMKALRLDNILHGKTHYLK